MATIAFVGLGNMGGPMAINLCRAGHEVCVFDLDPAAVDVLVAEGAHSAANARAAAENAEFVITMLPAGRHVSAVYLGDDGLINALDSSTTLIDSSTIDAATARTVAEAAGAAGVGMLDAPVSGGVAAAAAGTLAFMCGGDPLVFERAKPILESMGKKVFHAGGHGAGQVAKACNNMLLAIHMIGTSEALRMGVDNGLDPSVLSEIMLASSGRNWSLEVYNPFPGVMPAAPASNEYRPGFMVDLMVKDLGLAMETAVASGVPTPMGALARSLFAAHARKGNGSLDFSSILKSLGD
ncbi:MAG: 3-hydroxyisobutyrate dehydrogenase [Halieaceae bacterium]|jgi:3-hydroxyisobutyrate dehydrogenase